MIFFKTALFFTRFTYVDPQQGNLTPYKAIAIQRLPCVKELAMQW